MNVASRLPDPSTARAMQSAKPPFLGFGLGLRTQHYDEILNGDPPIDWFEVISENYMLPGGQPLRVLDRIRERYPVVMHGVSLSIASTAPPNFEYLAGLKDLARRVEPKWISDHLCWTGVHGKNLHDLLPIPYTAEALDHGGDASKAPDRRSIEIPDLIADRMIMGIDDVGAHVAVACHMELHHPIRRNSVEEGQRIVAMVERADIDIVDVEQQPASGAAR